MLQVAVLIAMPSQSRVIRKNAIFDNADKNAIEEEDDDDEEESKLPELVLGTTRVNYRQPKSGKETTLAANSPLTPTALAASPHDLPTLTVLPEEEEPLSPDSR